MKQNLLKFLVDEESDLFNAQVNIQV